jgi:hypothetical protein
MRAIFGLAIAVIGCLVFSGCTIMPLGITSLFGPPMSETKLADGTVIITSKAVIAGIYVGDRDHNERDGGSPDAAVGWTNIGNTMYSFVVAPDGATAKGLLQTIDVDTKADGSWKATTGGSLDSVEKEGWDAAFKSFGENMAQPFYTMMGQAFQDYMKAGAPGLAPVPIGALGGKGNGTQTLEAAQAEETVETTQAKETPQNGDELNAVRIFLEEFRAGRGASAPEGGIIP